MGVTRYQLNAGTAVITFDRPPVNSLSLALRAGIAADLEAAASDPGVDAIVLIGNGRAFSAGADIKEFGTPLATAAPDLRTLIRTVEESRKPVIAAVGGACMGGGFELALGAHFRIATRDASIALPEVKLGLIPGAGGTQRLPRLIGVEMATEFMIAGEPWPAARFKGTSLFDACVDGDLLQAALAFSREIALTRRPLVRVRDLGIDRSNAAAYFQIARERTRTLAGRFPAPLKCIDAVEAAVTGSFEEGLRLERSLFVELLQSSESRALRHVFTARRAAAKVPGVPADTPLRPVAGIGVIGAGTMGCGITMNFLNAGMPVTLLETDGAALEAGLGRIRGNYAGRLKRGALTEAELERRMGLVTGTLADADLAGCDLIIEAAFEDPGVKESLFRRLDAVAKPGAILATNTSTLDVNAIAHCTRRPQDVLGMHFFSPAHVMKLLEVVRGAATAADVLATVMRLARTIDKIAVVAGVCDGFIGNRMLDKYAGMARYLVVAGATPWQVDEALEDWGMAMGPFRMGDLAGNDIGWAIRKRRYRNHPPSVPNIADRLCELGRFGQKTGRGWYAYQPGGRGAIPDPEVERLIDSHRRELGLTPRPVQAEEIVQRCIYALINEGARILDEGIAVRASDIDLIYLYGYGFPMHRGGPMLYADQVGLGSVAQTMREFAASSQDEFWEPAPLISRLLAEGRSLT